MTNGHSALHTWGHLSAGAAGTLAHPAGKALVTRGQIAWLQYCVV